MKNPTNDFKENDILKKPQPKEAITRARLHFSAVEKLSPELAIRVKITRDRVMSLEKNFKDDSSKNFKYFNYLTITMILVSILAVFPLYFAKQDNIITMFIVGLILASARAFGFHKRFSAMFAAQWKMKGLRAKMDQEILEMALNFENSKSLSETDKSQIAQATKKWNNQILLTTSSFGKNFGQALEKFKMSSLPSMK